jgi:hypothetical protein
MPSRFPLTTFELRHRRAVLWKPDAQIGHGHSWSFLTAFTAASSSSIASAQAYEKAIDASRRGTALA